MCVKKCIRECDSNISHFLIAYSYMQCMCNVSSCMDHPFYTQTKASTRQFGFVCVTEWDNCKQNLPAGSW